jgi:organic radical activating enzyme
MQMVVARFPLATQRPIHMTQASLKITEIFYSLQGESTTVGLPTVFVRLTGCPLRCGYFMVVSDYCSMKFSPKSPVLIPATFALRVASRWRSASV